MSLYNSYEYTEFSDNSMSLRDGLGYVKQLVLNFDFRSFWRRMFRKDEDELSWLLNPHEATMMASFNKNVEESYQQGEKVTLYRRGVPGSNKKSKRRQDAEKKTYGESAFEIAKYMGMGVYMTTTSFPSPFLPVNDLMHYDDYPQYNFNNRIW